MNLAITIFGYLFFCALTAIPIKLATKIVKVDLGGFFFCLIAVTLSTILQIGIAAAVPVAWFYVPMGILVEVVVVSFCLGTSLTRAAAIVAIQVPIFLLVGAVVVASGLGTFELAVFGHAFKF